jgi:hypothetical protein
MSVGTVSVANTLITCTGINDPAGTPTNNTSSPPAVITLMSPPVPEYNIHGQTDDGSPTYGMSTVSLFTTALTLDTCNF